MKRSKLREEFGSLCESYRADALRVARSQLGEQLRRRVDSQDLLQESLATAWAAYPRVRERLIANPEGFATWLAKFIENKVHELARHHRRKKRDVTREVPARTVDRIRDDRQSTPSSMLAASERSERVMEKLSELPPRHREVLNLMEIQGLSLEEAAIAMGKTKNATGALRWKALQALGRKLRRNA